MVSNVPDLQQAWDEACAEFQKSTGCNIASISDTTVDGEDVVNKFKEYKAKDAKAHEKINKAKKAVRNTLVAIERIGQVAAQGASMVFGSPATIAMNCVSFLIDAGKKYAEIAHDIDDLFSRIATIMERFQLYRAHEQIMHPAMIRVAHRLLMAVVSICGRCYKVLHKPRISRALGVALFSSDGGIKSQFDILASLEAEEQQMKGTLTLIATKTSKRDIVTGFEQVNATGTEILKSMSQLSASSAEQKILNELREKLDVDDSTSKAEYAAHQSKLVSGTCSWIQDDPQYQSWSDIDQSETSLLVLKGDEGSGKSYALTTIIRDLKIRYPQGQSDSSRTSIGYYYLAKANRREAPNPKAGSLTSRGGPSVRDALKTWAFQAANNDLFYQKDVAAMFKKGSEPGDRDDFWQRLFLNHLDKGANFLLLLDGIHELEEQELSHLISLLNALVTSNPSTGRFKIMMTSRTPYVQKLSANLRYDFAVLDLREKTHSDIEIFIREKADNSSIFQRKTPQIQQLKERVCSGLLKAVNGSFFLADVKLREIASKYDPEEVMQVVEKTMEGANLYDSILEGIRKCNRTLNAREMQNLNTLLLWIIHGEGNFLISELEALLNIQQGLTSLQPLSGDIRNKFSAFFEIDGEADDPGAAVVLKYDLIADYFRNTSSEQHSPETTVSRSLTKGEIQMVQHFIEKLCEQDIYSKLGLQAFFDQKLSKSDISVAVDCENAHATIALTCLRVLTGEFSEDANDMIWYSGYYLTEHLKKIDLDNIDPRLKAELGPRLVKLLTDIDTIKKADEYTLYPWWNTWSYDDDGPREVLRLLRSSAVMKKITGVDEIKQAWVKSVMGDASPEVALLREVAKVNAELWLSSEDADTVMTSFDWLYGYLNKIESSEDSEVERLKEAPSRTMIDTKGIDDVLQKLKSLQNCETSTPISLRNLAVTYRDCKHIPEAIDYFHRALAADANYLLAHLGLARTYEVQIENGPEPDWEKALAHFDIIIDNVKLGTPVFTGNDPETELNGHFQSKATLLRKLFRHEEAHEIYNQLLQKDPTDDQARLELIHALCETQAYSGVVEMLQTLQQEVDEETQRMTSSRLFHTHADDETFHHAIVQAFKQTGNIPEVKVHYQQAIHDFKVEKTKQNLNAAETHYHLSYHFAAVLYTQAATATEKEEGIQIWERILVKASTERGIIRPVLYSARRLAKWYIAKAIEAGRGSAVADEMLCKVKAFAPAPTGESIEEDDISMGLSRADVRALLGRYYSAVGEVEKAREELRPAVDVGIKLLSDEDPENDYQGYRKLGDAFMDFRDDANAIAAWSMIQPTEGLPNVLAPSETSPAPAPHNGVVNGDSQKTIVNGTVVEPALGLHLNGEERTGADTDGMPSPQPPPLRRANTSRIARSPQGPLSYNCDGRCGKRWTYADDVYICRECIDVQFDAPCLEKLRQGNIGRDICDPTHDFMHVPSWDLQSLKRAQEGKVLVGDQVLKVDAWLEGIKREWGL